MPRTRTALLTTALALGAAAPAQAEVVWTADATRPIHEEWASYATRDRCSVATEPSRTSSRIRQVDAPPGSPTRRAYRVELRDGDVCFGNERAELGQANPHNDLPDGVDREFREGQERWISFWVAFEPGYPVDVRARGSFHSLVQFKQRWSGPPPFNLGLADGGFEVGRTTGGSNWRSWPKPFRFGDVRTGVAYRFTWHVRFSSDDDEGFLRVFADLADGRGMREVVPFTRDATLKRGLPSHLRIGAYRTSRAYGSSVSLYGGTTVATSREEAERRAFGG